MRLPSPLRARAVTITFRPLIAEATTAHRTCYACTRRSLLVGQLKCGILVTSCSLSLSGQSFSPLIRSVGMEKWSRHPTLQLRRASICRSRDPASSRTYKVAPQIQLDTRKTSQRISEQPCNLSSLPAASEMGRGRGRNALREPGIEMISGVVGRRAGGRTAISQS